jgi:hypothetical protein
MTSEAQKYIRVLLKEDPRKFFEVNEDHKNGIASAIFNEIALTSEEIINIQNFIMNGSPEIIIEFREEYLRLAYTFDEVSTLDLNKFNNLSPAKSKSIWKMKNGSLIEHEMGNPNELRASRPFVPHPAQADEITGYTWLKEAIEKGAIIPRGPYGKSKKH